NVQQTKSGSLYIVGKRHSNLSATEFAALHGQLGDQIEPVNLPEMIKIVDFMLNLKDIAKSASYIQEGGMLITATKMALRAEKGLQFNIEKFCTEELFSEFLGFVVEIENESEFTKIAQEKNIHIEKIATIKGTKILGEQISNLKNIWKNGLRKLTN
ncbi:MAG: hypothetical protein N4A36_00115, partial [Candidatus Gracilibacteria bacterium]|nr:hypothetical protein [Candidatus Gracilibacteria bacterium]